MTTGTTMAAAPKDGLPSMIPYLTRVLKTPTIGACWEDLAAQARDENWSHEEYLAALLQRQVADRESKGTVMRIRTACWLPFKIVTGLPLTMVMFGVEESPPVGFRRA
ncbi:hypothetical protein ACIRVM_47605, partial [Streptomyces chartreusis]